MFFCGVDTQNWQDVDDNFRPIFPHIREKTYIHRAINKYNNGRSLIQLWWISFQAPDTVSISPESRNFFNDFDIFMTSPGRTADIGQNPKGALYTRKYSACALLPKIKISQIDPRILSIMARKVAPFLGHFLHLNVRITFILNAMQFQSISWRAQCH